MVKNKSYNRDRDKANEKELRINYRIKARKIRLIYEGGDQEILDIELAIEKAKTAGLDLVEISPNVDPPVCKILDYGKYKFQQEKRQKETKKNQKVVKLKEIRMQPKIDSHDLAFKSKHILDFLMEGDKVKVTVRFRGRELAHTQIGVKILENILQTLGENNFMLEIAPKMEGKSMFMIIAPKGKK